MHVCECVLVCSARVMPVNSYSLQMRDCVHSVQYPDIELQDVVPVPGCMLVHSRLGLSLLNPGMCIY